MISKSEAFNSVMVENLMLNRATKNEAGEFKKLLLEKIEDGQLKIVVDLANCNFMDSTFMGALVAILKKITTLGGNLVLSSAHEETKALLDLTGMSKVFNLYNLKSEAVNSFNNKL